VKGVLSLQDF